MILCYLHLGLLVISLFFMACLEFIIYIFNLLVYPQIIYYFTLSKTVKSPEFYPTCKLTSESVTVSWILEDDGDFWVSDEEEFLSHSNSSNWSISIFILAPQAPICIGVIWRVLGDPVHAVGYTVEQNCELRKPKSFVMISNHVNLLL